MKRVNENVLPNKSKIKKSSKPKSLTNKSTKSSGKQSTLSQFLSTNKAPDRNIETPQKTSVFDTTNRVQVKKKLIFSPDLFITQVEATQKPDHLYDFSYMQSSSNSSPPNQIDDTLYFNQSKKVKPTPCLAKTPIRSKIHQQQNEQRDFVRANAILINDIKQADTQKPAAIRQKNRLCVQNIDSLFDSEELAAAEDGVLEIMEKLDNPEPSNSQRETYGLADTSVHNKDSDKTIQKILNRNMEIVTSEVIRNDFDDSDELLTQVEMPQVCQQNNSTDLPLELWDEFFSTDSNHSKELDDNAIINQAPTKKLASERVPVKSSTVVSVSSKWSTAGAVIPSSNSEKSSVLNASQVSISSTKAVCGSPKQNESLSDLTRMTVSEFGFKPPPKMPPNISSSNNLKRIANITAPEPVMQKKPKLIDDLMKNGEKKSNEYQRTIKDLK